MILAPLGDVPEDPEGSATVGDAQSPGLLRRWTQQLDAERIRQVETFEVRPPGVQVVDHQLHHAVLGPLLLETSLQNEGRPADGKNGHVAVEEFLKAERLAKRAASLEILACVCGAASRESVLTGGAWEAASARDRGRVARPASAPARACGR